MTETDSEDRPDAEALIQAIRERARNLYLTRELLCTEAVVTAINKGLDGGLTDDQAWPWRPRSAWRWGRADVCAGR